MPKHVGVENLERINKNPLLEHLLVFLQMVLQDARFNNQEKSISFCPTLHMVLVKPLSF
jgi:hypothetical protein